MLLVSMYVGWCEYYGGSKAIAKTPPPKGFNRGLDSGSNTPRTNGDRSMTVGVFVCTHSNFTQET